MLQDSPARISSLVVRGDGEAGDFQVEGLNVGNEMVLQGRGGVGGEAAVHTTDMRGSPGFQCSCGPSFASSPGQSGVERLPTRSSADPTGQNLARVGKPLDFN